MLELLGLGFGALVVLTVVSALFGLAALMIWLLLLPFRMLGFVFKALGALLILPVLLLLGLGITAVVGVPLLLVAVLPALPVVLLVLAVWWLAKRDAPPAAPAR
jgi:hypothetical protein